MSDTALDRAIKWAKIAERMVEKNIGNYRPASELAGMWAQIAQADGIAHVLAGWGNDQLSDLDNALAKAGQRDA